jgi:hypothetical protein
LISEKNLAICDLEKITLSEADKIKDKIRNVQNEIFQLVCQSIKFSVKLMSKILTSIENSNQSKLFENNKYSDTYNLNKKESDLNFLKDEKENNNLRINEYKLELLTKIKLFSKISRIIIIQSNKQVCQNNSKSYSDFFLMIKTFTEKIQSKIYSISSKLIEQITSEEKISEKENTLNEELDSPVISKLSKNSENNSIILSTSADNSEFSNN